MRQRYAEIHGAAPAPPAGAGGPPMVVSAEQAAQHAATQQQRVLEVGLELVRREAELRSGQAAVPPSMPMIENSVALVQLPMGGGAPSTTAAAPRTVALNDEPMDDASRGTIEVFQGREDSPPLLRVLGAERRSRPPSEVSFFFPPTRPFWGKE